MGGGGVQKIILGGQGGGGIWRRHCSFSMQFPTVEECDFDRQFLFDEYVAISHRYDLKRVSFLLCKNVIV